MLDEWQVLRPSLSANSKFISFMMSSIIGKACCFYIPFQLYRGSVLMNSLFTSQIDVSFSIQLDTMMKS